MSRVSLKGICDMHVHTNPDLRLRAYNDLELADAAVRVGARAIVIKSHLGFTVNRANIANAYVKKVYGDKTSFTMYGGVVMNKVIGGVNPEAVEKGLKLGAKVVWLPTQSARRHLEKMGKNPDEGIQLVRDGKVIPELETVFGRSKTMTPCWPPPMCLRKRLSWWWKRPGRPGWKKLSSPIRNGGSAGTRWKTRSGW